MQPEVSLPAAPAHDQSTNATGGLEALRPAHHPSPPARRAAVSAPCGKYLC